MKEIKGWRREAEKIKAHNDKVWKIINWTIIISTIVLSIIAVIILILLFRYLTKESLYSYKTEQGSFGEAVACQVHNGGMTCRKEDGTMVQVIEFQEIK